MPRSVTTKKHQTQRNRSDEENSCWYMEDLRNLVAKIRHMKSLYVWIIKNDRHYTKQYQNKWIESFPSKWRLLTCQNRLKPMPNALTFDLCISYEPNTTCRHRSAFGFVFTDVCYDLLVSPIPRVGILVRFEPVIWVLNRGLAIFVARVTLVGTLFIEFPS
jgi:hypothetical protein